MNYYDDVRTYERSEFGVKFHCYVKQGGYTETVATIGSDAAWEFDHSGYDEGTARKELRNHLRRQARWAKQRAREAEEAERAWLFDHGCDGVIGGAFGQCSDGPFSKVWHGYVEPARACGRHIKYDMEAVSRGHIARMAKKQDAL